MQIFKKKKKNQNVFTAVWLSVTLLFALNLVLHVKVIQQNRGSAGIGGITQFILRSLLHVMANPAWGVKTANESSVSGFFWVTSTPAKQTPKKHSYPFTCPLYPVWDTHILSVTHSLKKKKKSSFFSLTFKGIKRYASNETKSTPMFDFLWHNLDQARARCN